MTENKKPSEDKKYKYIDKVGPPAILCIWLNHQVVSIHLQDQLVNWQPPSTGHQQGWYADILSEGVSLKP